MSKKYTTNFLEDTNGSTGSANQVLISTPSGINWVDGSGSSIIGGPYLPLAGGTMTGNIDFNDNVRARFGSGDDLQIVHDGSNSYIHNNTGGDLFIRQTVVDRDIRFEADNGVGGRATYLTLDGSTTHAYFSNPGNVGIGTTSPNAKLNVKSAGSTSDQITLTHSGNTVNIVAIGQESSHGSLILRANSGVSKVRLSAAGNSSYILDSNVGIGTTSPSAKLQVDGGVQMADDTDAASASKVGTLRYRTSGNNSYVDMCMQTGASTYEWVNIVQNNW